MFIFVRIYDLKLCLFTGLLVVLFALPSGALGEARPNSLIYIEFKVSEFPGELHSLVAKVSAAESTREREKRKELFGAVIEEARRIDGRVNRTYTDRVWFLRGYAEYKLDKFEDSLDSFTASLKIRPNNALSEFYQGLALLELGRCQEAVPRFQEVSWLVPSMQAEPLYYTAVCQDSLGEGDKAHKNYLAAVEKGVSLPQALKKFIEIRTAELDRTPDPRVRADIQKRINEAKAKLDRKPPIPE
jgi:tetratricopeptide (TPR) repeat protein